MAFFGLDQQYDLEEERRRFLEGSRAGAQQEDVAVYTWGEDSYDGLGEALQEGGDELNDETFGGSGAVARGAHSLESIWDDKSPFSVLPKSNGARPTVHQPAVQHAPAQQQHAQPQQHPGQSYSFAPFDSQPSDLHAASSSRDPVALSLGGAHSNAPRTLEEVEAEMREAFAARRNQNISPSQPQPSVYAQTQVQQRGVPQRVISPPNQGGTPPPRMHPRSQSPRFHHQQTQRQMDLMQQQQQHVQQMQLLELQERRKRQQQIQLLELEEQLRLEELERQHQIRLQLQVQAQAQAQAQSSEASMRQFIQRERQLLAEKRERQIAAAMAAELQQQRRYGSPISQPQPEVPFQQSMQYLPREIQQQQRMLAEMAQAEFLRSYQGTPNPMPPGEEYFDDRHATEGLRAEAMRKIQEAERMEEKRKRKLNKIRYMSRYNDMMTQSDKDFITRIQVSQLVTQDPYADDFYAQVYGAVMRSRSGVSAPDAVLKFGSGGGVGLGVAQVKGGRRPSAMQRMEQQVERIVNNARMREKEKSSLNSLQGALGKTSGRSYKAAPRQLLQVDANGGDSPTLSHAHPHSPDSPSIARAGVAAEAAKIGRQALASGGNTSQKEPLTNREALVIVERVYDHILDLEHLRREQPSEEDEEALFEWEAHHDTIIAQIWNNLQVNVPLETSVPHPFISLLLPIKGKRMLPRVTRHVDADKGLTLLTLLVACFSQLDVVMNSPLLDTLEDTYERKELDAQTQAFLGSVMQSILPTGAAATLKVVSGMLGVFLERNDIGFVARTRPGIALLTMFLSRVEVIKQSMSAPGPGDPSELPTSEDMTQWQYMFDHLFQLLTPHLVFLFPSVRQSVATGVAYADVPNLDTIDQPVWQFLAALALNARLEEQQILVASLRERVLENVSTAAKGWLADEDIRKMRLANVNIFLHALGLDSSQIAL
ncbi:hypothetical protein EUX98_g2164 [Antrodiella citrinella]|uniref:mRNA decay factor PAT1 domain-containing protein n=1 Tax=Antrodiella citrinella TaxID=2447956 RepID=A0A4S4N2P1_9APHY|nr:hypothetical protein EUX98_g2164 [Antrodiella citrinella]